MIIYHTAFLRQYDVINNDKIYCIEGRIIANELMSCISYLSP